ncbi:hypothetical protein CDAR_388761 [Caerostris darwini]|uniref:Uncharacterized protein n=1 Tax=Caerostris darwini TaxID=1538125 RepID=A0AAV4S8T3_9ARAC|nr:hypothetical protein CDAR_388761 [Caerostris darwini]
MDRSNRASTSLQSTQFPETLNITLEFWDELGTIKASMDSRRSIEHHIEFWDELGTIKASTDSRRGNEREDGSGRVEPRSGKRANSVGNSVAELNKPRVRNPETAECFRVQTVSDKLAAAFPLCLSALQQETVFGGGEGGKKKDFEEWRGNEREDGSDRVKPRSGKRANSVGNSVAELNKPRVRNPETAECFRVQTVNDKLPAAFPLCLSALLQQETVPGGGADKNTIKGGQKKKQKRIRKWRGNEREDGSDRVKPRSGKRANSVGNSVAELNKPRVRNPETAECFRVQTVSDKLAAAFPLCLSALLQETVFGYRDGSLSLSSLWGL